MRKRENIPFLAFGLVCLLAALLAGSYFVYHFYQGATAPVYTFTQSPSALADYMTSTLTSGSTVYKNDVPEFSLIMGNTFLTRIIGKTEGDQFLYAFPGQDPPDYAMLTGFMMPATIFRNSQRPPFDWRRASFKEIHLSTDAVHTKKRITRDPRVIAEVVAAMKGAFGSSHAFQVDVSDTLFMASDQLPQGLVYCAKMYIDPSGQVYLAENALSNDWFPAGQLFSAWTKK